MKVNVDWKLVLLLVLAFAFLHSSMNKETAANIENPVVIEGDFVDFDYGKVFKVPVIPAACVEGPSSLDRSPIL